MSRLMKSLPIDGIDDMIIRYNNVNTKSPIYTQRCFRLIDPDGLDGPDHPSRFMRMEWIASQNSVRSGLVRATLIQPDFGALVPIWGHWG
jgi:hypothetical protein